MRIKSYFTKSISEAMEKARLELGPDAMLVASNKTTGDAERLGVYEVVFGLADQAPPQEEPVAPAAEGLGRLRDRMEDLRKSVSRKREQAAATRTPPSVRIASVLTSSGFPVKLAEEIAKSIQTRSRESKQDLMGAARSVLSGRIRVAPKLGMPGRQRAIVALIGPPGVGKTTTLVKLAAGHGLAAGRPVRVISTDTYRLGGTDLLKKYSDAMGVRFEAMESLESLDNSLSSDDRSSLVLIDTPGYGPSGMKRIAPLAGFLSKRSDIDVHLVLPAYASYSDLASIAAPFQSFLPSKLIFAGADMCGNAGPMLAHAITTESAVSFVGVGQEVPEDLEEASASSLTTRLLPSLMEALTNAA